MKIHKIHKDVVVMQGNATKQKPKPEKATPSKKHGKENKEKA